MARHPTDLMHGTLEGHALSGATGFALDHAAMLPLRPAAPAELLTS